MSDLYFAYGSNLDAEDWAAHCARRGIDPAVLRPVGPATLPERRWFSIAFRAAETAAC